MEEFLTGAKPSPVSEASRAIRRAGDVGEHHRREDPFRHEHWRELLERQHAVVRRELARHGGREIDTAGDGFLAAFTAPARAIGCATAVVSAVRELGLEVRVGIHTGECEATGAQLTGLAVHLGARVAALAAPGQILVSRTVKDLVAGSGIELEDRGTHAFRGIPDAWQVFEVTSDHAT